MKPASQSPDFPDAFYRVTIKGLYMKDGKLLFAHDFADLVDHPDGEWELPGGGLDFGDTPQQTLIREIKEEMGLEVTSVAEKPTYIWTAKRPHARGMEWYYIFVLCYKFEVKNLDFTPTDECRAIKFFSKEELAGQPLSIYMKPLIEIFNPADF